MILTEPKTVFLMFAPRFHAAVESGAKHQTIRPERTGHRQIRPGDQLSLRCWTARPYWSKQKPIVDTVCVSVQPIQILLTRRIRICLAGRWLNSTDTNALAVADGFPGGAKEMLEYYRAREFRECRRVLIRWQI